MAIDVSGNPRPRQPDPLSDTDRARLQTLAGKGDRSAQEQFELGGLRARARHAPASRRVLEDIRHQPAPAKPKPTNQPATGTDRQRNLAMLREHMAGWS